ncbi:type 1 glutamine amidotransferase [bacterium]|nr:type 1 glutamine amidotransferase [bacterium]
MKNLNLLIVEGNLHKENNNFKELGIQTHSESLKESLSYYTKDLNIEVFNPCSEKNFDRILPNLKKYDGLIWGGSSLNIYNDCIEIRRQISFMKECFKNIKKILAICWGMQVAVTAAGGEVKKASNGAHIGIAKDIEINENGLKHQLYKSKNKKFNSPAFNFDEVVTLPGGAVHLASNKINKIQSINFNSGISDVWGLQYHPEITYHKMITLINFRKDKLINMRKCFNDEEEIQSHISFIEDEIKRSKKDSRMLELKNWLDYLKAA